MSFLFDQKKLTLPEFYKGKSIFITGGSGFIGKVLIEKLLRSCPEIKNIYVLMRPKKNKSMQERVKAMFDVPLFEKLKSENVKAIDKVLGIQGDVSELNLGLSEKDVNTLINTVSIIFHNAASVRFDDFLKSAILTNTRSTRDIITLAKRMKSIDAFIYVSTVYCQADQDVIEEKVYPPKHDWRKAIELAENYDEETLQVLSQKYIHPLPNTYTFTKALSERAVFDLCENQLPAMIMRPSIVTPTICEPIAGWVDNFNGPVALNIIGVKGLLRILLGDTSTVHNNVFVDNVAKGLAIAAWKKSTMVNPCSVEIYNLANEFKMPLSHFHEMGKTIAVKNPPDSYVMTMTDILIVRNPTVFYFLTLLLHVLPGLMIDALLLLSGNKPRITKIYRKTYIASISLVRFNAITFRIRSENYEALQKILMNSDKSSFTYLSTGQSIHSKVAHQGAVDMWIGVKKYLLNETPIATEAAIRKYARFVTLQRIVTLTGKFAMGFLIVTKFILPGVTSLITEIVADDDS
ncbi:unnamed protein product [Phaedon cochleariae]|uniref:Fatty acyl-CoA reductase n=1 Tax=Phaedon cochleariae TaxID=80249 RepID=A0A9P0DNY9_PHACE|nr:unnamed protein product [Phaedon cochleariae]